jgi:hypothetical protein
MNKRQFFAAGDPGSFATLRRHNDINCPTFPKAQSGRKRQFPELSNPITGPPSRFEVLLSCGGQ